jgi:hypothetical protein
VNGFATGAIVAVAGGIFGFWAIDGITKNRATNGLVALVAQVLNKMVCLIDPPSRLLFFSLSFVRFLPQIASRKILRNMKVILSWLLSLVFSDSNCPKSQSKGSGLFVLFSLCKSYSWSTTWPHRVK